MTDKQKARESLLLYAEQTLGYKLDASKISNFELVCLVAAIRANHPARFSFWEKVKLALGRLLEKLGHLF